MADDASLRGRTALITGGSRGIGLAIANALAGCGATLVITGRDTARLASAADEIERTHGGKVHTVSLDLADGSSVAPAFQIIRAAAGQIDILVNNAGEAASAPLLRTDTALWQRMLDVNLTGAWLCIRETLPAMMSADYARIINIASTAGLVGYAYVTAYVAAKHGLVGLTRSLALETARSKLTVNAICPGYTDTDLVRDAVANIASKTGKSTEAARASLSAVNPQGRLVQPEEIAQCVLWLCSTAASSVTGQSIPIAGGEVMSR